MHYYLLYKGSNQAVSIGKIGYKVDMVGQTGNDASGDLSKKDLQKANVNLDYMTTLQNVETGTLNNILINFNIHLGQAYIFSYPGDNSIILLGGANTDWSKIKESLKTCNYTNLI